MLNSNGLITHRSSHTWHTRDWHACVHDTTHNYMQQKIEVVHGRNGGWGHRESDSLLSRVWASVACHNTTNPHHRDDHKNQIRSTCFEPVMVQRKLFGPNPNELLVQACFQVFCVLGKHNQRERSAQSTLNLILSSLWKYKINCCVGIQRRAAASMLIAVAFFYLLLNCPLDTQI